MQEQALLAGKTLGTTGTSGAFWVAGNALKSLIILVLAFRASFHTSAQTLVQKVSWIRTLRAEVRRVFTLVALTATRLAFEINVSILAWRACLETEAVMEVLVDTVELATQASLAR